MRASRLSGLQTELRRPLGGRLSFGRLDNLAAQSALHATGILIKNKCLSLMTEIDLFEC